MLNQNSTPSEYTKAIIATSTVKANNPLVKHGLLGFLGGIFISFGSHARIAIMQNFLELDMSLGSLLGDFVFPMGYILVILSGAESFTGNNLMSLATFTRKITFTSMLRNWIFVYLGNFLGAFVLAAVIVNTGILTDIGLELTLSLAHSKLSLSFSEAFYRGICCNILVVLAVWLATGAKDFVSKILSCFFPIILYVLSGFENSIVNIYYFSLAFLQGFSYTWHQIILANLIPVTLGNIIGGAVIVPLTFYFVFVKIGSYKEKGTDSLS